MRRRCGNSSSKQGMPQDESVSEPLPDAVRAGEVDAFPIWIVLSLTDRTT